MQNSKFPRKASYKYYILRSLKHGTETSKDCDQSITQISTKAKWLSNNPAIIMLQPSIETASHDTHLTYLVLETTHPTRANNNPTSGNFIELVIA